MVPRGEVRAGALSAIQAWRSWSWLPLLPLNPPPHLPAFFWGAIPFLILRVSPRLQLGPRFSPSTKPWLPHRDQSPSFRGAPHKQVNPINCTGTSPNCHWGWHSCRSLDDGQDGHFSLHSGSFLTLTPGQSQNFLLHRPKVSCLRPKRKWG